MSLASFLALIARNLRDADIPFMLTGSLAAAYYGAPRATQDVDLVIESQPDSLRRFVEGMQAAGLYVDLEAALEALHTGGQFNAIDPSTGWKADLIIAKLEWSELGDSELQRRDIRE